MRPLFVLLSLASATVVAACSGTTAPDTGAAGTASSSSGESSSSGGSSGVDASTGSDPFSGPSVCTSGKTFTGQKGASMRPGEACNACHTSKRVRTFAFAGTVYPTGHEPNDCVGTMEGPLQVVVTDSAKTEVKIPVSTGNNGNFSLVTSRLVAPFTVRVENTASGKTRVMNRALSAAEGDCNSCHTAAGSSSAPGRIVAP